MDIDTRQRHLRKNLELMQEIYPQYVPALAAQPDYQRYTLTSVDEKTFLCEERSSSETGGVSANRWMHGPNNPWDSALVTLQEMDWRKQSLFLILRPGLGYIPLSLYQNLRKGRDAQRMLLVEDRVGLLRLGLELFDWTDMLRSDRVILILDERPAQAALDFFQTNPVAMLPPLSVLYGVEWGEDERRIIDELQRTLPEMAQQVHTAALQYLDEVRANYSQDRTHADPPRKRKVLFVEPEHDYLADSMARGFETAGCETAQFNANRRLLRFLNPYVWLIYTREQLPDVLLWMNRNTLSPEGASTLHDLPIQKALWFLDSPKRVETTAEELQTVDAYFCFDATYLPYLQELSGKPGYYLPTAAGIEPLPECRPDAANWPQRQGPRVGFMGALAAQRFQAVQKFWRERDPEFVRLLDEAVEAYLQDASVTLEERYNASEGPQRLPFSGFVALYLEERATYLMRLRALLRIQDLGLRTYGGVEWRNPEWAGALTECYTGQTPQYREELPSVYYHTLININVFHAQCFNSTNPRVYDVLAAGGFLLTEYRPAIVEEFTPGEHLVCYRNLDELRERCEYYLEHVDEREAIARAGQQRVLERCTYSQRAAFILDRLMKAGAGI